MSKGSKLHNRIQESTSSSSSSDEDDEDSVESVVADEVNP